MYKSVLFRLSLIVLVVGLAGCKEGTLGPDLLGGIEGVVLDYETNSPVAGASITTSPPTDAIVTNAEGKFILDELSVGNYTIQAKKPGYGTNSVTVSVRENRMTQAMVFLELADEDDEEEPAPDMSVEITNWWNSSSNDSAFVNVEYRAQNSGKTDIKTYEVYFRIEAEDQSFYHEENGANLRVGQANLQRFQKYLPNAAADAVVVEDFWAE